MAEQNKASSDRKWSKEEAERYYIENSESISLRELAKIANRSEASLFKWSKKGGWVEKRNKYWTQLTTVPRDKSIVRVGDLFEEGSEELAIEHLNHHRKFRELIEIFLDKALERIKNSEDPIATLKELKVSDLNYLSQISDRAVKGERASVALDKQIDPNAAIKLIMSMGYQVIDPSIATDAEIIDD